MSFYRALAACIVLAFALQSGIAQARSGSHRSSGPHYSAPRSSIRAPRAYTPPYRARTYRGSTSYAPRAGRPRSGAAYIYRPTYRARAYHAPKTYTPRTTYGTSRRSAYGASRDGHGRIARSAGAKDAFKRSHPCPSTGRSIDACTGYVIDHIRPLKRGGADAPSNMQWQTIQAAKAKDKWE